MFGCNHSWSWPQAQGYRAPSGKFVVTGPAEQVCPKCTARRVWRENGRQDEGISMAQGQEV